MLIVVAQNEKLGESALSVLQAWSDAGLLREFLWCRNVGDALAFTLVRPGEKVEGNLEFLVSGLTGDVFVLNVVGSTRPVEPANGTIGKIINRMSLVTDRLQVRPVLTVVVPESANEDVRWAGELSGRVVLWAAEDRSDPKFWSTPFPFSLPGRAAHAIASLGGLWDIPNASASHEELLNRNGATGKFNLARAFTRMVNFPQLRRALLDGLELDDGNVPRPTGTFDRVDFAKFMPALARVFVQHQPALTPQDLSDYIINDHVDTHFTLVGILKKIQRFIVNAPKRLQAEAIEAVRKKAYNAVAEKFESLPGVKMKRWEDFDDRSTSVAPTDELVLPAFIEDGPSAQMWMNLWKTSFSLIDGSPIEWDDWELALPPHDRDHYPVVSSRFAVVGRNPFEWRPKIEEGEEVAPGEAGADAAAVRIEGGEAAEVPEEEAPYLDLVRRLIRQRAADAKENLESAQRMLSRAEQRITEIQDPPAPEERPKGLKKFFRLFREPKAKYQYLSTNSRDLQASFARILSINFVTGAIATTAGLLFSSIFGPIVATASVVYFVASTVLELVVELWIAESAHEELLNQLQLSMRQRFNSLIRISVHTGEEQRFARRLKEFATWEGVIRGVALNPWLLDSNSLDAELVGDLDRPQSFVIGTAVIGLRGQRVIHDTFKRQVFTPGWLTRRYEELRSQFLTEIRPVESGVLSQLTPESDPGQDIKDNLRDVFNRWLDDYLNGPSSADDLWRKAESIVGGIDFKSEDGGLVDEITPLQPHGRSESGEAIELPHTLASFASVAEFFAPIVNPDDFPAVLFDSKALQGNPGLNQPLDGGLKVAQSDAAPNVIRKSATPWMLCNVLQFSGPLDATQLAHTYVITGSAIGADLGIEGTIGLDTTKSLPSRGAEVDEQSENAPVAPVNDGSDVSALEGTAEEESVPEQPSGEMFDQERIKQLLQDDAVTQVLDEIIHDGE